MQENLEPWRRKRKQEKKEENKEQTNTLQKG